MDRVEKLQKMLSENSVDSFLQHALALELIKLGDDATAESLFKKILQREPGYVGSYYHLAKLLERKPDPVEAIHIYKTGMAEAQKAGDQHSRNELRMALEDLEED